jgi:imidazolonepropionase-like amidohydrolase
VLQSEASSRASGDCTVVIEGSRIVAVDSSTAVDPPQENDTVYDLSHSGRVLMPGLVTCHFHCAYDDVKNTNEIDMKHPATYLALVAARNVGSALNAGFTGLVGAAVIHNIDVVMKKAIEAGVIVGPRILASSRDLCTTGGPVDMRPEFWGPGADGVTRLCDGPDEFRKAVRQEIKAGVDIIKVHVTGGHGSFDVPAEVMVMTEQELRAAVDTAHGAGRRIRGHVASREGILAALDAGLDVIDHADGMDSECIERMAVSGTYVAPTLYLTWIVLETMRKTEPTASTRLEVLERSFEESCKAVREANEAGVKLVIGDDYGAGPLAHGDYARELAVYTQHVGIPPSDMIRWATTNGGELLAGSKELGSIEAGQLADLLVVNGDPSADIEVLADPSRLDVIMSNGKMVRCDVEPAQSFDL